MTKPRTVGQIRTDGFFSFQIVAIAAKHDIADTVVILEKVLDSDDYHDVYEITSNLGDVLQNEKIWDNGEEALQSWMDRAFGVNIF